MSSTKVEGAGRWWRLHFRNGKKIVVQEGPELERLAARKVPKIIHRELATIHTCSICGNSGPWTDDWTWYGSYADFDDGKPVLKFCSSACAAAGPKDEDRVVGSDWKQRRGGGHLFETKDSDGSQPEVSRYKILHDAKDAANVRKFPAPEYPDERSGTGWCRWCGEKIIDRKGKTAGKQSTRRTWHRRYQGDDVDCYHQYLLHTDQGVQREHIAERDGDKCACCPPGAGRWEDAGPFPQWMGDWSDSGPGWRGANAGNHIRWSQRLEVDHIVPLWRVHHFPPEERRQYFGPDNLWLLCPLHHRMKSKKEAADRAAFDPAQDEAIDPAEA